MQCLVFLFYVYSVIYLCYCYEDNQSIFTNNLEVQIGSKCTWNGLNGTCTSLADCPSAQHAISGRRHPSICFFEGVMPIVCCTASENAQNNNNSSDIPDRSSELKPGRKAEKQCMDFIRTLHYTCYDPDDDFRYGTYGVPDMVTPSPELNSPDTEPSTALESNGSTEYHQNVPILPPVAAPYSQDPYDDEYPPYIVPPISAGIPAQRNQYPHMALLGYGDAVETAEWLCGGSIISKKFVLTAAHCISSPSVGPVKYAAFGILKRSDPPNYWQTHNIARVIPHPEYQSPHKYHDIALLETEDPIRFNRYDVLPACLDVKPEPELEAEATGWGALGHRQVLADVLQTVTLRKYDTQTCSKLYPKHRHLVKGFDEATQMCYGDDKDPKDTCQGDSGGPLQVKNKELCLYRVLGVTSYGRQCGQTTGSGIYTRVYHYLPWIESIVWP
ncbi:serine protease snake isoform X2 [Spodoptera frugiperda]|uniref:Serine protease snake isoform X2 n=1 Tax=Spodoptera frugiperda TaxID=7108 RepID=A0A9R0F4C9_SPOFR|nr:serine protease snake isoform X2 [Spodoptera frugiperda]